MEYNGNLIDDVPHNRRVMLTGLHMPSKGQAYERCSVNI